MSAPLVRPPEERDWGPVADLTNRFIRETHVHFGDRDLTPESFREAYEASRDRYPMLVAESGGAFGGYARATSWRDRAAYSATAEVALYVADGARRSGVGRALYSALLDELRDRGFHAAVAGVSLPNEASARFHEAMGFRHVGVFPEVGRKFGRWHDVGFWQLPLG